MKERSDDTACRYALKGGQRGDCVAWANNVRMDMQDYRKLTLRQKIGQTMIMLPNRKLELELGGGSLEAYFQRYPVTGYFMGWKLFDGVPREQHADHIRKSVREYQAASDTYFERVGTCINAYSRDDATLAALVRALTGEIPLTGASPVGLARS